MKHLLVAVVLAATSMMPPPAWAADAAVPAKAKGKGKAAGKAAGKAKKAAADRPATTPPEPAPAPAPPAPEPAVTSPTRSAQDGSARASSPAQDLPTAAPKAVTEPASADPAPVANLAPAGAEPASAAAPAAPTSRAIGLDVAIKIAALVPSGKTSRATAAADGGTTASKAAFFTGTLGLRYGFPFLDRALSLGVEAGYYRLAGSGTRTFANDPDFGPAMSYRWRSDAVPVLVGLAFRLPIPIPVKFSPSVGFAAVWVRPVTTYEAPDGTQVADSPQPAWALGFYAGLEVGLKLGPGSLVVEGRYVNARTDLGFKGIYSDAYNRDLGDVQGANILAGYRFEL